MRVFRFGAVLLASPAIAAAPSIAISEPSDVALFLIAVAGLIIGRHASRRRPPDPD